MKFVFCRRFLAVFVICLVFAGGRAGAATTNEVGFGLWAYNTPAPVLANSTVTNFITISNGTGFELSAVYVTNSYSGSVTFVTEDSNYTNDVATNDLYISGDFVRFTFYSVTNEAVIQLAVVWQPLQSGAITNRIGVYALGATNTAQTNLVSLVYAGQAELGVGLALVSQAYITNDWVITNDWATYQLTVTNFGPSSASGVLLTNTLPPGILISPKNYTVVSNNLIYSVGTLADGGTAKYQFTIEPTNAGVYTLTASAGAADSYQTNASQDQATEVLSVTNYLATLEVMTNSGQSLDFQNGLVEQTIQVANTSGADVPAVRVVVTGLTNDLFNASGTNGSQPFVVDPAPLAAGAGVSLRLQYFPRPTRLPFPFTNGQLHAYAVPATVLNYTPLAAVESSTNLNLSRIIELTDGDMLIEFPSVLSNSYTVVYSDNLQFTNAMIASPACVAPANRVQWLDYGPPATISAPTNSSRRYYRVYLNP